ncbi:MAG: hypothetical protein ACRDJY_00045 [Thermoleophilaceae bacterium]
MRQDDLARGRAPRAQLLGLALAFALVSATVLAGTVLAEDEGRPPARAAAGTALKLKQTTIDKSGMVDSAHWTVSESAARWDTTGFAGDYSWTIPSSIPAGGAQGAIKVTATDKSGGRYNGVIGASGSIIEGGSVQAQALADKNGGAATKSDSKTFKLVPDSCGSSCNVTVAVQDGPKVTFRYEPAEPTKCASQAVNAFASACLAFGSKQTLAAPSDGTTDITPEPMPRNATALEVFLALRELVEQEERERLVATLAVVANARKRNDDFDGCMLLGSELLGKSTPKYLTRPEREVTLFHACLRLILDEARRGRDDEYDNVGRSAAGGCKAVFVPVFPKGTKVTKRKLRRARAAQGRQIAASCSERTGKLSLSVRARGDKKLPAITGRRIQSGVTHGAPRGAGDGPDRQLTVRWRARKG